MVELSLYEGVFKFYRLYGGIADGNSPSTLMAYISPAVGGGIIGPDKGHITSLK